MAYASQKSAAERHSDHRLLEGDVLRQTQVPFPPIVLIQGEFLYRCGNASGYSIFLYQTHPESWNSIAGLLATYPLFVFLLGKSASRQ